MGLALFTSLFLDLAFGEPKVRWHPIALLGRSMAQAERLLQRACRTPGRKKVAGTVLAGAYVAGAFFASGWLIDSARTLDLRLGWLTQALFLWVSISVGELVGTATRIDRSLKQEKPVEARRLLRSLVGRQTDNLDAVGIRKATLESLAENLVDAGTAPIFFALIGGAPAAFAYRIINTLDSMFGYKDERFRDFGWASARLDDAASWLPARITAFLLAAFPAVEKKGFPYTLKTAFSHGKRHDSPNSGLPIAGLALAVGITLGGPRLYQGVEKFYGYFGDGIRPIDSGRVALAATVARSCVFLFSVSGAAFAYYFKGPQWLT